MTARRLTFVYGSDLLEGDTLLAWWGFARITGFGDLSAPAEDMKRYAVFADGKEMTIDDTGQYPVVVTCPADVERGGLPGDGVTVAPDGWTVDYGDNRWLDGRTYTTVGDVLASTSWARRTDGETDEHRWVAELDEATRAPSKAFVTYCAGVGA